MDYLKEYQKWLDSGVLTAEEHAELEAIKDDPKEIESRFYGPLEFGTAGLRGTMAMGLHHMNIYVIRHTTQAFANVICAEGEKAKERGVAIAMDCRLHGMEFARAAAEVCAANGIKVRIFESLRPTPELSFAVRHYGCQAGINVTASHNPKEYNGYKVYWEDGAQLPPHHASAIAKELEKIDIFTGITTMPYDEAVKAGLITVIGRETDEAFLKEVMAMTVDANAIPAVADSFKLVYTPFHGCGHKLVPEALKRAGVKHLLCEPQQMVIDGNFPTVKSPNPENPEGFYLAIDLAKENDVDFILGTDPEEFPELPAVDQQNALTVGQSTLRSMIAQTLFAVSDNESRPVHTGSLFEADDISLTVVSVDGYRLALRRESLDVKQGEEFFQFVVPGSALSEVEKICSTEDPVTVIQGARHVLFQTAQTLLVCRRLEGEFLTYRNAIPRNNSIKIECETRKMLQCIERVSLIISEKLKSPLRCVFGDGQVSITTKTGIGDAADQCPIEGDGQGLEIGFNNKYLKDALKAAPAERLRLEFTSGVAPCVILPAEGEENFTYMVLPVRLKVN